MSTHTIRLHRVLRSTPEKVYRAFIEAEAMSKWLPPYGFTGKVHHMDAKVGGIFKMSFTNFGSGKAESFGGKYIELVPHERIRYTDHFDNPNMPGELQVTVTLKKVFCGTEVNIVQEGCRPSFRRRRATSAGRNRSPSWRCLSRPRFLAEARQSPLS